MKRPLGVLLAVVLSSAAHTSAAAGLAPSSVTVTAATADPAPSMERELKRLTFKEESEFGYWHYGEKGKILGPDGGGVHVFTQTRQCSNGRAYGEFKTLERQTTTPSGVFDMPADGRRAKRKYQARRYPFPRYPKGTVFSFFIPAGDGYFEYRVEDRKCYF